MSPPADYGSAIETLVTAISLIKQSKVSADDRCKVLISSLQDCLHGIESKSYGSASRYRFACFSSPNGWMALVASNLLPSNLPLELNYLLTVAKLVIVSYYPQNV